jgi:dipeptidyl-peptidase 4
MSSGKDVTAFPKQNARTRRFSLGVPHAFAISEDGLRVVFLRSPGDDPVTSLWLYDVAAQHEEPLVEPRTLTAAAAGQLPTEERARRERAREASLGIVRFSADDALRQVAYDLEGALHVLDVDDRNVRRLGTADAAVDVRIDPTGSHVAYVTGGALHVIALEDGDDRCLLQPESADVTYGLAEFVAAEEMDRDAGYWWAPDGTRLLVARVDVSEVERRYIADAMDPAAPPIAVRYPAAGTANADVSLLITDLRGEHVDVQWDSEAFEYLVAARWSKRSLLIVVQSRDQRAMQVLEVDPATGATTLVREDTDDAWVDIVLGVPDRLGDGALVWTADVGAAKRLLVGDDVVTGDDLQVREVLAVEPDEVVFTASREPTEVGVWRWTRRDGAVPFDAQHDSPSMQSAVHHGGTTVMATRTLQRPGPAVTVHRGDRCVGEIESLMETPLVQPDARIVQLGERRLRSVLLLPAGHVPGSRKLPVLLDPYGGPAAQRVVAAYNAYLDSQWFADQGFAVVIVDGRGTPGRDPMWSRTILGDRAEPVLEDQVDGLHAAAAQCADLDLSRVAIRGWSYGGFLAALAVLRRPDVFHAAVAGAPVTDQRLYDTHYTERYLGQPQENAEAYEHMSLLRDAPNLQRPLLLIHGLNDDNVYAANTLRLSAALTAAGRPHSTLLLPGVTHSTNRAGIAATLPLLQLAFLRDALRLD